MPFPYDRYPWLNFQELNLAYFIKHFREIFQEWNTLYHDLTEWKDATDQELEVWKTETMAGLDAWRTLTLEHLETSISGWETDTLAALDAWKAAFEAEYAALKSEVEGIRDQAAANADAAANSAGAAALAANAAEAAAASIQASAAQIQTNSNDILYLNSEFNHIVESRLFSVPTSPVLVYILLGNGLWSARQGTARSVVFEIPVGALSVDITAPAEFNSQLGFFASYADPEEAVQPDYSARHSGRLTLSAGDSVHFAIDDDMRYIYVQTIGITGNNLIPEIHFDYIATDSTLTSEELPANAKAVGERLLYLDPLHSQTIDFTDYNLIPWILLGNGEWGVRQDTARSSVIKIPRGTKLLEIDAVDHYAYIALFASYAMPAQGDTPIYASYQAGRIHIDAGSSLQIPINDDMHFLYLQRISINSDVMTPVVRFYLGSDKNNRSFKMLAIGSSSNQDMLAYIPDILSEMMPDIDFTIACTYIGSARLQTYLDLYAAEGTVTHFNLWLPYATSWYRDNNATTLPDALHYTDWDIITIQDGAANGYFSQSSAEETAETGRRLSRIIQTECANNTQIGSVHLKARQATVDGVAYNDSEVAEHTMEFFPVVMDIEGFFDYIPQCAAVQSARSNSTLAALGDGGRMEVSDHVHIQNGMPCLLEAYVVCLKIAEWVGRTDRGVYASKFRPTQETINRMNASGMTHGSPVGMDETYIACAQEIATIAVRKPEEITDCSDWIVT